MAVENRNPLGIVLIEALDKSRNKIMDLTISLEGYSESHPMIDDDGYRNHHCIRFVSGRIYDYDGILDQEFCNEYDSNGMYIRSRIIHSDGTIMVD